MGSRTSDKRHLVTSLTRYKWVALLLPVLVLSVVFGPSILSWLSSGTGKGQGFVPTPTPTPLPYHPSVVAFCGDTPPLYTLGHQAALSVANMLDASVKPGSPGILFYGSRISSQSYPDTGVSFSIPAVSAFPAQPVLQTDPDPYKAKQKKDAYEKALAAWQAEIADRQKELSALRAQVHQETDRLRRMAFPYDDKGADPMGCIALASEHFQGATGIRELIIASPMFNTVSPKEAGTISLPGVIVKLIFRTCVLSSAAACEANNSYWSRFFKQAGAKDVQILDVAQSSAMQLTL